MKQKKTTHSHSLGNRTVIGIVCIVVALAICFGFAPLVNRLSDGKTEIVRLVKDVPAGATITEADIEVVEVGSYNLPQDVITDKASVMVKASVTVPSPSKKKAFIERSLMPSLICQAEKKN